MNLTPPSSKPSLDRPSGGRASRARILLCGVLLVGLVVVACGSRSVPEPATGSSALETMTPDRWSAQETASETASNIGPDESSLSDRWWTSFEDPRLDELIDEGLENNRTLHSAVLAVDQALAQAKILGADAAPQVEAELDGARRRQVFVGLPIPGGPDVLSSTSTSYGLRLNVRWEIDLWGRLRARQRASLDDVEAARAEAAAVRLSLAGQIARLWFAVAESGAQVELGTAIQESYRATRESVEARYRNGLSTPVELRLARANEARASGDLERRRRILDGLVRQLEVLLGRYPSAELADSSARMLDAPEVDAIPAGLPAQLVARRPDLVAEEHRLNAAGWRLAEARRALFPRLALTAAGGALSDDVSDLLDQDFSIWNLAGGLLQPIFQGGRLRSAVDFARASRERALAEYVQAVLEAFAEVERALAAEHLLRAEEQSLARAAEEARAAHVLAEERYRHGVGTYLEQLESQRLRFDAEGRWLVLKRQRLENRIDLFLALGGGFAADR